MTVINTDGMAFIGPGSEWFWTALERDRPRRHLPRDLPPAAGPARGRRHPADGGMAGEVVLESADPRSFDARDLAQACGQPLTELRGSCGLESACVPSSRILGTLEAAGYVTWKEVEVTWGEGLVMYWALLGPTIMELRAGMPSVYSEFERLAKQAEDTARRRGEGWSVPESAIPELVETQIGVLTAWLRMSRDVATGVIPADPSSVVAAAPVGWLYGARQETRAETCGNRPD